MEEAINTKPISHTEQIDAVVENSNEKSPIDHNNAVIEADHHHQQQPLDRTNEHQEPIVDIIKINENPIEVSEVSKEHYVDNHKVESKIDEIDVNIKKELEVKDDKETHIDHVKANDDVNDENLKQEPEKHVHHEEHVDHPKINEDIINEAAIPEEQIKQDIKELIPVEVDIQKDKKDLDLLEEKIQQEVKTDSISVEEEKVQQEVQDIVPEKSQNQIQQETIIVNPDVKSDEQTIETKEEPAIKSPEKNEAKSFSELSPEKTKPISLENSISELNLTSELPEALKLKQEGVEFFKKNQFEEAFKKFNEAYEFLKPITQNRTSSAYKANYELLINILNNMSLCCINVNNPDGALDWANTVQKFDPINGKAYYRKGMAYRKMGKLDDALGSFELSETFAPNDSTRKTIAEVKKEIEKAKVPKERPSENQKDLFQKMLGQKNSIIKQTTVEEMKKPESQIILSSPTQEPGSTIQIESKPRSLANRVRILAFLPGFLLGPMLYKVGVNKNPSLLAALFSGISFYLSTATTKGWIKGFLLSLPVVIASSFVKYKTNLKF